MAAGRLIILSGPSGAGKSTVVRELIATCPLPLKLSVSATTRAARVGEVDGREYHFVTRERFERLRDAGGFLECKEVFGRGDWYGTLAEPVERGLREGTWMLLEIDVQGAQSVLEQYPDAISLFVHPGSLDELARRLRRRGTDDPAAIARRLEVAAEELQALGYYRYEIINRSVDHAVEEICRILKSYREGTHACWKN